MLISRGLRDYKKLPKKPSEATHLLKWGQAFRTAQLSFTYLSETALALSKAAV